MTTPKEKRMDIDKVIEGLDKLGKDNPKEKAMEYWKTTSTHTVREAIDIALQEQAKEMVFIRDLDSLLEAFENQNNYEMFGCFVMAKKLEELGVKEEGK